MLGIRFKVGGMNVFQIAFILLAIGLYYAFRFSIRSTPTQAVVRLKRIRYVARFFRWICCAAFGFMIFVGAAAIIAPSLVGHAGADSFCISTKPEIILSEFKSEYRWLYPVFWGLFIAFCCRGIGFFYRLFKNLEIGQIFVPDNVRCIRNIGWWLVIQTLLAVGLELSKLIWAIDEPRIIDVSGVPNGFLEGCFVIFAAWVMDEGRKIQEEQELTV